MRREADGSIVLSKRNLLTLLQKVDDPTSARTIYAARGGEDGVGDDPVIIRCEPDEVHYRNRPEAGPVHPHAETFIQGWRG